MRKEQDLLFKTVLSCTGRWFASSRFHPVSYDASNEDIETWKETIVLFLLNVADTLPGLVNENDLQSWCCSFTTLRQFDIFVAELKKLDKVVMHHLHFDYSQFLTEFKKELRGMSDLTRQFLGRLDFLFSLVASCDSSSIAAVHQICSFAERVTVTSFPGAEERTLEKWLVNYDYIRSNDTLFSLPAAIRVANKFNKYNFWQLFSPHHSDGSVLEKEIVNGRKRRLTRQEKYLYTNGRITRYFQRKSGIPPIPAPFITAPSPDTTCQMYVPKGVDDRRIVEPECCERVFNQHGVAEALNHVLKCEYGDHYHRHDSSYNGRLALDASKNGKYDTIDISSASDSVRWILVQSLLRYTDPSWVNSIRITRSRFSTLPDGTLVPKVAVGSMGSPMTFPLETLVFCELVEEAATNLGEDPKKVRYLVYGDDIIVPHWLTSELLRLLLAYGFQPNMKKTFVGDELFRESCGTDAVLGVDITPVRISRFWKRLTNNSGAQALASNVDLANRSFGRLPLVRRYLIYRIEKCGYRIPFSEDRTGLVLKGNGCTNLHLKEGEYDCDLQYRTVKVSTLHVRKETVGKMPMELSYWEWLQNTEHRNCPADPGREVDLPLDELLELPTSYLSSLGVRKNWTPDLYT